MYMYVLKGNHYHIQPFFKTCVCAMKDHAVAKLLSFCRTETLQNILQSKRQTGRQADISYVFY